MRFAARDIEALRRLVWRLLALAVLADRAALRCFPVRFVVLAILGHAEAVARAYVVETMPVQWPDLGNPREADGGLEHAAALALRLRMLAAALAGLLRWECLADCCRIAGPPCRAAAIGPLPPHPAGHLPVPADTS